MNVNATEVVDMDMVKEKVEDMAVIEVEVEDEVTIDSNYLVHMIMEIYSLSLRYIIKVNINHFPDINKLQFKNSKVRLAG